MYKKDLKQSVLILALLLLVLVGLKLTDQNTGFFTRVAEQFYTLLIG